MLKKTVLRLIPEPIKNHIIKKRELVRFKKNSKQDMEKFIKYSFLFGENKEKRHYEADLIFYYHKIEKGLALPNPRVGFGKKNVEYLLKALERYVNKYGWDEVSSITLNILYEYYYFNKRNDLELSDLYRKIKNLKKTVPKKNEIGVGGVTEVNKSDIDKSNIDFKSFAYSRYSIRDFAPGAVSNDLIIEAVQIAQKTPSVCNRQSAKVYSFSKEEDKEVILQYQNGNAGFGHKASKILIVTVELKDFRGTIERNQSYIDGGMYSMSLIYALHSLGIGTCPLNLSITNDTEKKLKKAAKISDSEVLMMMIAVGHIPDNFKVASSPRRKANEVLTIY